MPKVRDEFRSGGVDAVWLGPQDFARAIRESYQLWEKALAGINYTKE